MTARVDQSTRLQLNEEPRARKGNAATMICVDALGDEADTRCVRCLRDVKQLHSVRERSFASYEVVDNNILGCACHASHTTLVACQLLLCMSVSDCVLALHAHSTQGRHPPYGIVCSLTFAKVA